MRIQRNYFNTREEAEKAQQECACAECGASLKWGWSVSRCVVLCLKNPNHKHIRTKALV
jgi:hypothetical protein